jgi:hypothetical protein
MLWSASSSNFWGTASSGPAPKNVSSSNSALLRAYGARWIAMLQTVSLHGATCSGMSIETRRLITTRSDLPLINVAFYDLNGLSRLKRLQNARSVRNETRNEQKERSEAPAMARRGPPWYGPCCRKMMQVRSRNRRHEHRILFCSPMP